MISVTKTLAFAATALLAGCFDMELALTINSDDMIEVKTVESVSRTFYDNDVDTAKNFCSKGGVKQISEHSVSCTETVTKMVRDMAAPRNDGSAMDKATIEQLPDRHLKFVFPLHDLKGQAMGKVNDAPNKTVSPKQMQEMIRMAFAGHSFVIKITGQEIISTTGDIVNGGKTAKLVIPLTDVFSEGGIVPEQFVEKGRGSGLDFCLRIISGAKGKTCPPAFAAFV